MLDYNFGDILPVQDDPHGQVILLDVMGSDAKICQAARISYGKDEAVRTRDEDRGLIRYLMRHRHTSPFEMAELQFNLRMPIFVARQWVRHRTANMNEVSARYTELPDDMFVPKEVAAQSMENKQGRAGTPMYALDEDNPVHRINVQNESSYAVYADLLGMGVTRELARGVLPLNIYTEFVWKIDLHNLMHFLKLRLDPHAQKEIREYAEQIRKLVALHFPITYEAFVDYQLEAYTLSRMEVELLQDIFAGPVPEKLWRGLACSGAFGSP